MLSDGMKSNYVRNLTLIHTFNGDQNSHGKIALSIIHNHYIHHHQDHYHLQPFSREDHSACKMKHRESDGESFARLLNHLCTFDHDQFNFHDNSMQIICLK